MKYVWCVCGRSIRDSIVNDYENSLERIDTCMWHAE